MQDPKGDETRQVPLVITSLNWGQLLGQMSTPSQETYWERAIHLALDLQGILHLAQRVQEEVHQAVNETEAVVTREGIVRVKAWTYCSCSGGLVVREERNVRRGRKAVGGGL